MEEKNVLEKNETIKEEAANDFVKVYENFRELLVIEGRSFKEWTEFFDCPISSNENLLSLRKKMRIVCDKYDIAENILSNIYLSKAHFEVDEKIANTIGLAEKINSKVYKTKVQAERAIANETLKNTLSIIYGDMLLKAWKEQINKLKTKMKIIEVNIYSYSSELRTLGMPSTDIED